MERLLERAVSFCRMLIETKHRVTRKNGTLEGEVIPAVSTVMSDGEMHKDLT